MIPVQGMQGYAFPGLGSHTKIARVLEKCLSRRANTSSMMWTMVSSTLFSPTRRSWSPLCIPQRRHHLSLSSRIQPRACTHKGRPSMSVRSRAFFSIKAPSPPHRLWFHSRVRSSLHLLTILRQLCSYPRPGGRICRLSPTDLIPPNLTLE